jgi:site-specific DNA-cytosine methylase
VRVLVACEFSGIVRDAFRAKGHYAVSCDLLPSEIPGIHLKMDVRLILDLEPWDLLIAHPPCTRLTVAGARWFKGKEDEQLDAIRFCEELWACGIPKIAIENPIGVLSTRSKLGKPKQIVQPWMFGHGEVKATCLWLKNLPALVPTNIVEGRHARVHREPPGPDRWKNRSRTYTGIANAMAEQWGSLDVSREA